MNRVVSILVGIIASISLFAQGQTEFPDSPYDKPHIADKKPISLQTIRYADVMWSKKIERTVPLREKLNHPLYFPNNEQGKIGSRYSLTALTINGIGLGYFQAYDPMSDAAVPISQEDFNTRLGAEMDTISIEDEDGNYRTQVIESPVDPSSIKYLILREEWIFDKQRSVMEPRIMWITSIREYEKSGEVRMSMAYKIYYPSAQPLYAKNEVFNPKSDGDQKTFYDLFSNRLFSSFISRETNPYGDREINSYKLGIEQLYEAERVKDFIFKFEHDLWEY